METRVSRVTPSTFFFGGDRELGPAAPKQRWGHPLPRREIPPGAMSPTPHRNPARTVGFASLNPPYGLRVPGLHVGLPCDLSARHLDHRGAEHAGAVRI